MLGAAKEVGFAAVVYLLLVDDISERIAQGVVFAVDLE
jgi:hypothetical protein